MTKTLEQQEFERHKGRIKDRFSKDYIEEAKLQNSLFQFDPFKFFYHAEAIMEFLQSGDVSSPITIDIDSSYSCNQNCTWCSFDYLHSHVGKLNFDIFQKLIEDLVSFKKSSKPGNNGHTPRVRSIIFSGGGEPTLNNSLDKMVDLCKLAEIKVGLYTNGTNITKSLENSLLEGSQFIRFSFEAPNEELYNQLHRPVNKDNFKRVVTSIESLAAEKKKRGYGPTIGISFLVHPLNHLEIYNVAVLAKNLGVDYFQVKPVIKKAWEDQVLDAGFISRVRELYPKTRELADENFQVIIIEQKLSDIVDEHFGRNYEKCLGHYFSSVVMADGCVYLCVEHRGLEKYKIGDLKTNSFYEIWNSERRQEVIKNIDLNECQPGCKGHFRTLILEKIKSIRHVDFI